MPMENRGPTPQETNTDSAAMIQTGLDKLGVKLDEAIDASRGTPAEPTETPETPPETLAATPPTPAVDLAPLKAEFDSVRSAVTSATEKTTGQITELQEKVIGMEQKFLQRGQAPAIITGRAVPAIFEVLTASDAYKNEMSRGAAGRVENLPSILLEELTEYEQRASTPTVIGSTAVGGLTQPYYRPGIVEYPRERFGLWEFLNKMTTDGEKVEVIKESEASSEGGVLNTVEVEIDGDPTPKTTCTLYNTEGFEGGMYVKFHLAASTPRLLLVSNDKATGILTFATDAITFDAAVGTKVTAEAIGATAEEGLKPYGYMDVSVVEEVLKTMATMLKVTVQRMKLAPMLLQWMRTKLMAAAKRSYSWHCLYGDDAQAGDLAGFFSETGVQTYLWSTGGVVGDNQIDAIMKAVDLIVSDGWIGVVMNKTQWSILKLLKGTDGHYLSRDFGPVAIVDNGPGQRRLGPHPVELDPSCRYTAGVKSDVLIADFVNAHELYINPNLAAFDLGMINDDFEKNIRRARYEECAQNAILTTKSYVYLNLDAAKT